MGRIRPHSWNARQTLTLAAVTLATVAAVLCLAGCSSNSGSGGGGTRPMPITVAFQSAPPTSLLIGSAPVPITAVVANDSASRGVDWNLTCSSTGNCGTLAPLHTDSGAPATYTPPATVSGSSETVNIVAFAASDHSKNVPASFAVKGFNQDLSGTYAFEVLGSAPNFGSSVKQIAGVFVADGNGNITAGEQTFATFFAVPDPIVGGSYTVGSGGSGTLTIMVNDPNVGTACPASSLFCEDFTLTVISSSKILLSEIDPSGPGVGTAELQTSTAAPSGGYAFVTRGVDGVSFAPMAFGGVFNVDSPGTISGAGSVADQNLNGTIASSGTLSGTVSGPDALGAVTMSLASSLATAPIQFTGYIVDTKHMLLIENDVDPNAFVGFGSTGGVALSQGSATGTFHTNTAMSGPFVYGLFGQSQFGSWASAAWAGLFTADGAGNLHAGYGDQLEGVGSVPVSDTLTGTYTVSASGTGRVAATTNFTSAGPGPSLVFYLTGSGNPALVLDTDATAVGGGIAYPQAGGAPSFAGPYGLTFTANNGNETDASGQSTVSAGTLSGTANAGGLPYTISGAFTSGPSARFAGTLSFIDQGNNTTTNTGAYYIADPTQGFFIENDGIQVSLGYFSAQSPLQ